jgi:tRNA nucleotidyltransferase (CCA-adding enzyme)
MPYTTWEHFYHMADIGVRGRGQTLAEAFEQVAMAMTAVITEPEQIQPQQAIDISCSAPDQELLLVDWLNALIYEMATRKMLFSRFEVILEAQQLTARAWGEKIDISRHQPTVEIKGATYTELKVAQQADGSWLAQCVVDV